MTLEGDDNEKREFGDVDSAVEFITHRPHENFTIYNAKQSVIEDIRSRIVSTLTEGD